MNPYDPIKSQPSIWVVHSDFALTIIIILGLFFAFSIWRGGQVMAEAAHSETVKISKGYYQMIEDRCAENFGFGDNCCLNDVRYMRNQGLFEVINGQCKNGFKPAKSECEGGIVWCEPR